MGYLIPGNKFARYGDHLLNADSNGGVSSLPDIRPGIMPLNKTAALRSATAFAGADISRSAPTFNDPRYSFTTLSIPTDLRTLNGLYRFFDDTDPVVGNSLRLHVEFPLSRVSLKQLPDPVIQRHYEEMCSKINFEKLLFDIGLEYWRIGNVFTFGAWNTAEHMWDQFVILNPDYVTVESTYLNQRPLIKLQPDEHLKKVVSTGQPKFLYDQLPKEIIKYVRMGQEIPLSPNNTFHISHNRAPYETLGRSIIKRILKTLIYEDRMSMANFAIATRQVIPLTVVKLGDANSGWIPSNEEIDSWKEIMASREIDPNFSVVYHWGVDVQFYGASSRIWNLTAEFNRVMKWKLIGLGISEGLLTGGSSYATAYAQLEVLRQRYLHFQHMLGHFVYKGIFEPVAQQCGFYKTSALTSGPGYIGRKFGTAKDGFKDPLSGDEIAKHAAEFNNPLTEKYINHLQKQAHVTDTQYVYPELDWDLLSLGNDVQYRNFLMNFDKLFPGARKISDTTFYRAAKLDPETEQANLLSEYQTEMEQKLEKGKLEQKFRKEFEKEGIPFPGMMGAPPPGQPGAPGPGGTPGPGGMLVPPGAPPPMGGTGGGNLPGTPAMTPNAPLGQNQFQGVAPGRPGAPPNPAASRVQSLELQRRLTSSFAEIESENDLEAAQLKIANQEAGILSVEDEDAEL